MELFRRRKQPGTDEVTNNKGRRKTIKLTRKNVVYITLALIISFLFFIYFTYDYFSPNLEAKLVSGTYYSSNCWVPNGRKGCAPSYIVAGAMKSGTTSLFSYLIQHPSVLPLKSFVIDPEGLRTVLAEKEVRFFNDPGWKSLLSKYGHLQSLFYYLDLFEDIPPTFDANNNNNNINYGKITGEATPLYINQPDVALRIKNSLPYVKIILLLRHPVERAYSDFWFRKSLKTTRKMSEALIKGGDYDYNEVFEMCIQNDFQIFESCHLYDIWLKNPTIENSKSFHNCYQEVAKRVSNLRPSNSSECSNPKSSFYKFCLPTDDIQTECQIYGGGYSLYAQQLVEWVSIFPPDQLLVLQSEQFYDDTPKMMRVVSKFLRLNDNNNNNDNDNNNNNHKRSLNGIENDRLLFINDNDLDDSFDWESITGKAFNIINPFSSHAKEKEITTTNGGKKGLQIGAGDTSSYPPLSDDVRDRLAALYAPLNRALYQLLENSIYPFPHWE